MKKIVGVKFESSTKVYHYIYDLDEKVEIGDTLHVVQLIDTPFDGKMEQYKRVRVVSIYATYAIYAADHPSAFSITDMASIHSNLTAKTREYTEVTQEYGAEVPEPKTPILANRFKGSYVKL